jgi:hypothetical protein
MIIYVLLAVVGLYFFSAFIEAGGLKVQMIIYLFLFFACLIIGIFLYFSQKEAEAKKFREKMEKDFASLLPIQTVKTKKMPELEPFPSFKDMSVVAEHLNQMFKFFTPNKMPKKDKSLTI